MNMAIQAVYVPNNNIRLFASDDDSLDNPTTFSEQILQLNRAMREEQNRLIEQLTRANKRVTPAKSKPKIEQTNKDESRVVYRSI